MSDLGIYNELQRVNLRRGAVFADDSNTSTGPFFKVVLLVSGQVDITATDITNHASITTADTYAAGTEFGGTISKFHCSTGGANRVMGYKISI